jgi:hypothetical protein
MPTNRPPLYHSRRGLSATQEMAFWLGTPATFASEDEARELWFVHRDRLLELFGRPGRKPMAWWKYEAAEHGLTWPGYDLERSTLFAANLLTEEEHSQLLVGWRREFEKAQAANFSLTLSPERILHGQAARAAHYRWADIPAPLVRRWSVECRRRRRTVRKLATTAVEETTTA